MYNLPMENFMLVNIAEPCWICSMPTHWVEINFESFLCPGKCEDKAWHMFFEEASQQPEAIPFTETVDLFEGEQFTGWRLHTKPKKKTKDRQSYYHNGKFIGYVRPLETGGVRFVIKANNVVGVMPVLNKAKMLVKMSATW